MKIIQSTYLALFIIIFSHNAIAASNWDTETTSSFIDGCIKGVVDPARIDYFTAAEKAGNTNPKPFPAQKLEESVKPLCTCVVEKLQKNNIASDDASLQSIEATKLMQDAVSSGECKLGGKFGSLLSPNN